MGWTYNRCFVCLLMMWVLAACVALAIGIFAPPEAASPSNEMDGGNRLATPANSSSTSSMSSATFDCDTGFSTLAQEEALHGKMLWCCERFGGAHCPTTSTMSAFNCDEGFETWKIRWSNVKKFWCCRNRAKGCPAFTTTF